MTLDEELSAICRSCGACCDGTLFTGAELMETERADVARRLELVEPVVWLRQPCRGHSARDGCTIYSGRPKTCRDYRCALLEAHAREGGPVEARIERVRTLRELAARVRASLPPSDEPQSLWDQLARTNTTELLRDDPELALDLADLTIRMRRDLGAVLPGDAAMHEPSRPEPLVPTFAEER
jgi:hypothetical protein